MIFIMSSFKFHVSLTWELLLSVNYEPLLRIFWLICWFIYPLIFRKDNFVMKYYTIETSGGRQVSTTFYFYLRRIPMYLNGRRTLLCDMIRFDWIVLIQFSPLLLVRCILLCTCPEYHWKAIHLFIVSNIITDIVLLGNLKSHVQPLKQ